MASSLAEAVRAQLNVRGALQTVLVAWADACRETVPVNSGILKDSISYGFASDSSGYLQFAFYGQLVATRVPLLSQARRNVQSRARYQMRVGRPIFHPDEWYGRAWESANVQDAVARFPVLLFSRG